MQKEQRTLGLPEVYGNGMVLQREQPLVISGFGGEGLVIGRLNGVETTAEVKNGRWTLRFPPVAACDDCEFSIASGEERIVFRNVAIGEVWLAGGQSNMDFKLYYDEELAQALATAEDPLLRVYTAPQRVVEGQTQAIGGGQGWLPSSAKTSPGFSAVAYYFGRRLREALGVPVGIVCCSMGGTPSLAWIHEQDIQANDKIAHYWTEYQEILRTLDMAAYVKACTETSKNVMSNPIFAEYFDVYLRGELTPEKLADYNNRMPGGIAAISSRTQKMGPFASNRPAGLFHTMLEPLAGYPAKGVIFYQGESDSPAAEEYDARFGSLIRSWRRVWNSELPFFFIQLAGFGKDVLGVEGQRFEEIRAQQQKVSETVPDAWLVSAVDLGREDNIHPRNKRPVGDRLADAALHVEYGLDTPYASPKLKTFTADGTRWQFVFEPVGDGLELRGETVSGLKVFGADGEIGSFKANVEKDTLTLEADAPITCVEFGYAPYADWNLYSSEGLPVLPFAVAE